MVGWRIVLWAVIVLTALTFLYMVRGILMPFVLAFIISAVLEPTIRRLRKKGWTRGSAVFAVFGVFLTSVLVLGVWLLPVVGGQLTTMRDKLTELAADFTSPNPNENYFVQWNPAARAEAETDTNQIDKFLEMNKATLERFNLPTRSQDYMHKYIEPRKGDISKAVERFFSGFIGTASSILQQGFLLLFAPLLAFMMMMDGEKFRKQSIMLIPPSIRDSTVSILADIGDVFMNYLRGVTTAVLGYMAAMSLVLTLLGVPYSIILGIIVGCVYLIPYLNGLISISLICIMTGLSGRSGDMFLHFSNSWTFGLVVAAIFFICHLTYDSLLFPRLVGKSVGLHPIVSMFVIFSCGALFGIVGMIIAFPLAGSVKVILDRLLAVAMKPTDNLNLPALPLRHRGPA
jgi:predicted PurR-regulated permease PerM